MGERALDPQTVVSGERRRLCDGHVFHEPDVTFRQSHAGGIRYAVWHQGYAKDSRYVDYNGWRVGLVSGCLALKNPKTESSLYLKAVYTPGKEAGLFKSAKLVGVYTLAQRQ